MDSGSIVELQEIAGAPTHSPANNLGANSYHDQRAEATTLCSGAFTSKKAAAF
jgi:hypothetical protein